MLAAWKGILTDSSSSSMDTNSLLVISTLRHDGEIGVYRTGAAGYVCHKGGWAGGFCTAAALTIPFLSPDPDSRGRGGSDPDRPEGAVSLFRGCWGTEDTRHQI